MRKTWVVVCGMGALLATAPLAAQDGNGKVADRPLATREELQAALQNSPAASAVAARIQSRLTNGDFRRGDRIALTVQGEKELSDTFVVGTDGELVLPEPTTGSLSLKGVLRSELQPKLTEYVAKFRNNPVVRAQPLIRLSVQGEVAKAGIYAVPPDAQLADALMAAGGTTQFAKPNNVTIERNGKAYWKGSTFNTDLDALGVQDGDQILVQSSRPNGDNLRTAGIIVSMAVGLYTLTRALHL